MYQACQKHKAIHNDLGWLVLCFISILLNSYDYVEMESRLKVSEERPD